MPTLSWPRCCSAYKPEVRQVGGLGMAVDAEDAAFFLEACPCRLDRYAARPSSQFARLDAPARFRFGHRTVDRRPGHRRRSESSTAGAADPRRRHAGRARRVEHGVDRDPDATLTITRDADSPNSVAASRSTPPSDAALGDRRRRRRCRRSRSSIPPARPPSPPSAQSCADRIEPSRRQIDEQPLQRALARQIQRRRHAAHQPVHRLEILAAAELAEVVAEQDDVEPGRRETRASARVDASSITPTTPMTGVGRIALAVGLVVEADVAAGDRNVERAARLADARPRLPRTAT